MKKKLHIFLIVASVLLIIFNTVTTDSFDQRFWLGNLSSILIIISMVITIRSNNKTED